MWEWLTRVQSMPEASRRKVAITSAAVVTLIIVGIWMLVELLDTSSFADPLPAAQEESLESLREDVVRLQQVGSEQVENWRALLQVFKSQPQGE